MSRSRQIIIAGGGIAGLTAALAFARKGFAVRLFERAAEISEVGAGLQLSPNATRLLSRLGVLDALRMAAVRPQSVIMRSGPAMKPVARVPLGDFAEKRWRAPYLVTHRADLQSALLIAAQREADITITTGAKVADFASHAGGVTVSIDRDGRIDEVSGLLLVGADGVWSRMASRVKGASASAFSGKLAWRATISASDIGNDLLDMHNVTAFMHPLVHVVAYPIRAGMSINMVAVTEGPDVGQRWAVAQDNAPLLAAMAKASPRLQQIAQDAAPWVAWALHGVNPAGRWTDPAGVALIGDAAHAMTPFAAQGAVMGIEDAVSLAASVGASPDNIAQALTGWEQRRKPRVTRVIRRGAFNHFTWHAAGPVALVRNVILGLSGGERLAASLDWLYGYDAEA